MEDFLLLFVILTCAMAFGAISAKVGGAESGCLCFLLGFLMGPIGILIAAVLGSRAPVVTQIHYAAPAATLQEPRPRRRVVIRKPGSPPPVRLARLASPTLACPHCQTVLSADGLRPNAPILCPACNGQFQTE